LPPPKYDLQEHQKGRNFVSLPLNRII
jgi:hypothetical protein